MQHNDSIKPGRLYVISGAAQHQKRQVVLVSNVEKEPILRLLDEAKITRHPQYQPDPKRVQVETITIERIEGRGIAPLRIDSE